MGAGLAIAELLCQQVYVCSDRNSVFVTTLYAHILYMLYIHTKAHVHYHLCVYMHKLYILCLYIYVYQTYIIYASIRIGR